LKNSFSKNSNTIIDTLKVWTDNVTYYLPILINQSIYSSSAYPITFNVTNSLGPIEGANIYIVNVPNTLVTNSSGIASINLISGNYSYAIQFSNHNSLSGQFIVLGFSQTVNAFLQALNVESVNNEPLNIYPNPFCDEIIVDQFSDAKISIYNLIGNLVMQIQGTGKIQRIDTMILPKGVYIVSVESKNGTKTTKKLIKN